MDAPQELGSGIGAVFPFHSEKAWRTRMRVIYQTTGIKPVGSRDNEGVRRASYAPARTRAILNWSSARILARLEFPTAAMTLEVDEPAAAAALAVKIYREEGFDAKSVDSSDVELGIPAGFMYFVLIHGQTPILFWPKIPDPELLKQMAPPKPWTEEI